MESQYTTLHTIYSITNEDPQPVTYQCRPREIILRQYLDWSIVQQHLKMLEEEGYVVTRQLDTLIINITMEGINKILSKNLDYQS